MSVFCELQSVTEADRGLYKVTATNSLGAASADLEVK